jgi:hypothetical protein
MFADSSGQQPAHAPDENIPIRRTEFVAVVSSLICGIILVSRASDASLAHQYSLIFRVVAFQYNPGFWVPGLFLGFAINHHLRHRSAYWLGPVNVLLLIVLICVGLLGWPHPTHATEQSWAYQKCMFFSLNDGICGPDAGFGRLLFAGPILGSVAYSIGSWFGLRRALQERGSAGTVQP